MANITRKDAFKEILNVFNGEKGWDDLGEEMTAKVREILEKESKPTPGSIEAEEFAMAVATFLRENHDGSDCFTSKQIASEMGESGPRINAAFKKLVAKDELIKFSSPEKGKPFSYALA